MACSLKNDRTKNVRFTENIFLFFMLAEGMKKAGQNCPA